MPWNGPPFSWGCIPTLQPVFPIISSGSTATLATYWLWMTNWIIVFSFIWSSHRRSHPTSYASRWDGSDFNQPSIHEHLSVCIPTVIPAPSPILMSPSAFHALVMRIQYCVVFIWDSDGPLPVVNWTNPSLFVPMPVIGSTGYFRKLSLFFEQLLLVSEPSGNTGIHILYADVSAMHALI